jgi:hypothetical protein
MIRPKAPYSPARAATAARGKFPSVVTSGIKQNTCEAQTRPGSRTPGPNTDESDAWANSSNGRAGGCHMVTGRSTFCARSTTQ